MAARRLLFLIFLSLPAFADDAVIDRTGSWDVSGPLGPAQGSLSMTTDEGTWMNLDVHPDGETIIFDLLGDLYLLPIAGGDAIRLTEGPAYDFQPRFSPDGSEVLFTSDRGGIFAIWTASFEDGALSEYVNPVSYTHLTLPTTIELWGWGGGGEG